MIEEYEGDEYTREALLPYGFQSPQGPMHLSESVKQYLESIKSETTNMIDYLGVLDYLEHNREVPYQSIDRAGSPEEAERLRTVMEKGQGATGEIKKMADLCASKFGLDKCLPISWLDGSNTKTRRYLWAQMKYRQYESNPTSISIFVEMCSETDACYRISLEIKNDGT